MLIVNRKKRPKCAQLYSSSASTHLLFILAQPLGLWAVLLYAQISDNLKNIKIHKNYIFFSFYDTITQVSLKLMVFLIQAPGTVEFYFWHCKNLPHTSKSLACILCLLCFVKMQTNLTVLILTEHGPKVVTSQKLSFFYLPQRCPVCLVVIAKVNQTCRSRGPLPSFFLSPGRFMASLQSWAMSPSAKPCNCPLPTGPQISFGKCWTLSCVWCLSCPGSWVQILWCPLGCADLPSPMPSQQWPCLPSAASLLTQKPVQTS